MAKRLTFSTATPNDQGGIIPNEVLNFSRFKKNPVCLKEHKWGDDPIGMWADVRMIGSKWSGLPILHDITEVADKTKKLYDGGWIRGASIGGEAIWRADPSGRRDKDGNVMPYINKDGFRECVEFILYEISIVTLPSNEDAVTEDDDDLILQNAAFSAKCYNREELKAINDNITTLNSKFKITPMLTAEEQKAEDERVALLAAQAANAKPAVKPTTLTAGGSDDIITMKASEMPGFMTRILQGLAALVTVKPVTQLAAPTPKDLPEEHAASDAPLHVPQNTPIGLACKPEKEAMEASQLAAEKAIGAAQAARLAAEKPGSTDVERTTYSTALQAAQTALTAAQAAQEKYTSALVALAADDDEDEEMAAKPPVKKEKTTNAATGGRKQNSKPEKPTLVPIEEMATQLAAMPDKNKTRVLSAGNGKTFSMLAADKGEGRQILNKVMSGSAGIQNLDAYSAVLNSLLEDSRYDALTSKMRVMMNVPDGQLEDLRANPGHRGAGFSLKQISAQLASGNIEVMGRDFQMRNLTTLSSTDNALAAPALNTIEWLPLAIFKLFPSTGWKNPIPMFSAQMTGANTGLIWANITADPTIYKGTQPSNPSDYTYNDGAVSLSLTPYWLQPMRWTPLTMHQLRYDQMATGWAQAFSKLNATIDDNLLYTLASTVPASSVIYTSGISGYQTNPQSLYVNGTANINKFYWNPAFVGNLLSPTLNDIIGIEQLFNTQDFPMEDMEARLVYDPIMEAYLKKDPESKSLLTRFITDDGADLLKYSHTVFNQRSRVAIFDPASGQVKDPNGVIPSTALSASLAVIPSQVGIGVGVLDVFMVQDPTNYGYKMSADIRMGIAPLRQDFSGTALFTFGPVA